MARLHYKTVIEMIKGESRRLKFQWQSNNQPLDLTGATFRAVAKRQLADTEYLFSKADAAFDKSEVAQGIVYLTLWKEDTMVPPLHEPTVVFLQVEANINGYIDRNWIIRLMLYETIFQD